jgi:hypothetical protein
MADSNLILQYDFSDPNSLTFFDEQVSACWDLDKSYKAIYSGEDKNMPYHKRGLQVDNQAVEYTLKTPLSIEADFEFTLALDASRLESVPLFRINEAGSVVFTQAYLTISIDRENTTKIVYPNVAHQGGLVYITIGREGSNYTVVITTPQGVKTETIEGSDKSFEITGLFGGLFKASARILSIELFDGLTEFAEVVEEGIEEEIVVEEVVEEEEGTVEEEVEDAIEEAVEEVVEEVVEDDTENTENTDKMTPFNKLLKEEVALLESYEGLAKAFNAGKQGRKEIDAKTIEGYVTKNKDYIVKFIYYALTSIEAHKGQEHSFLYQRAKYIAPMFGNPKDEEEGTKEREYGFKTEQVYDTFEFGKISNANVTNKMLVKLLMEEYDLWKEEIVKI